MTAVLRLFVLAALAAVVAQVHVPTLFLPAAADAVGAPAVAWSVFRGAAILGLGAFVVWRRRAYLEDVRFLRGAWLNADDGLHTAPVGHTALVVALAVGLTGAAVMARRLDAPVDGENYFRQTHVAANIEKMVASGHLFTPETYNKDIWRNYFDLPVYQGSVAAICRTFGVGAAVTARSVNFVLYVLGLVVFVDILRRLRFAHLSMGAALALAALSPLHLYYARAVIPDPLVIVLALVALDAYLGWDEKNSGVAFRHDGCGGFAGRGDQKPSRHSRSVRHGGAPCGLRRTARIMEAGLCPFRPRGRGRRSLVHGLDGLGGR
ncbi:MAG: hypothetical protein M5R36_17180 [Deltaproteobacteria bacterium]|nr:hypothetical protein [Deltaproteobacteria bacterium]